MTIPQAYWTINEILDKFDFEKVHAFMVLTNWKWFTRIPTVEELRDTAHGLLQTVLAAREQDFSMVTGGLTAYKLAGGEVGLTFELEGYSMTPEVRAE